MLKVLIVDDELLVRTNLRYMLDWEANGFSICGEASNGAEAIKLAQKMSPDIILSDIRMPVMDGLELSHQLKKLYPESILIVLSNYDDFEYVKGTLKNGAIDYILKHNLSISTLSEALHRAKESASKRRENTASKPYSINNLLALRENFLIHLLSGFYKKEDEIKQQLSLLDIPLSTKNTLAVVMIIDDYSKTAAKNTLKDASLLEFTVINIIEEILNDFGNGCICHIGSEKYVLIFSFESLHSNATINFLQTSLLNRIIICLKKFTNISVSFSIGSLCTSLLQIPESYESAEIILKKRFYEGKNCILRTASTSALSSQITGLEIEREQQILTELRLSKKDNLLNTLNEIFQHIKNHNLSLTNSQIIFSDLLSIVNRLCREHEFNSSLIYSTHEAPHILLSRLETLDDTKNWFIGIFERLFTLINDRLPKENYSGNINKAVNYIRKNFTEDITLSSVAEAINISSVYLSKLFKKETEMGFTEFVCDLRLEKAKSLLEEGKEEIKSIIKLCGFNNYAYFFNVFKQKTGLTPKEFITNRDK